MARRELVPASVAQRWPPLSLQVLAALALCTLIVVAATVDLVHTESRLPDISPACDRDAAGCVDAVLSEQLVRDRAAEPLQDRYDSRAWLYAFAILAIAALATAWDLRARPRAAWPRVFANLGIAGVWLGIAAVLLLLATDGNSLAPPPAPTLLLPVALLVTAVSGTLIGRSEGWAEQGQGNGVREMVMQVGKLALHIGSAGQVRRSRLERLARWLTAVALSLTAVTSVLALISLLGQPDCAGNARTPGWTDPLDALTAVAAIGAMAAGIGALVLRRWIAALVSLVVAPIALLVVLASTCAFY
jgi:hypothetical protein